MPKGVKGFQKGHKMHRGKKYSFEHRKNISIGHKGQIPWNKDKKTGYNKKQADKIRGRKLSEEHKKKLSNSLKGKKRPAFSEEWKRKISERTRELTPRGTKHPNWKGGVNPLRDSIRHCFKYRQWRSDIFQRDDFTCQVCGVRSGNGIAVYLEADHYPKTFATIFWEYKIKSVEDALNCEELWNINNGRTVCKKHNPRGGRPKNYE